MISYFPKYLSNKVIAFYMLSLLVVTFTFLTYSLPLLWFIWGISEVVIFCVCSNFFSKKWATISPNNFKKKIFWLCFIVSIIYVVITYFLYIQLRGEPFEFDPSDGLGYHNEASWFVEQLKLGTPEVYWKTFHSSHDLSDKGYLYYLDLLYAVSGCNIFLTRVIKCFFHGYMCVCIYKLATRNFGETVGRMAAIFCVFLPNFNFYVASHRKEMEMIFLAVLFLERTDFALRCKRYSIKDFILPFLLLGTLFTFRTVLGIAGLFAICLSITIADKSIISKKKQTQLIVILSVLFLFLSGGPLLNSIEEIWNAKIQGTQGKDMEWRAKQKGGNTYAKYAGAAIFAPMIVAIPFPTMVEIPAQYNQQRLNGGYFIKNLFAIFVILSIIDLWKKKELKAHMLIYAYTFSYLLIIAFSNFAHSERFHLPALPILMIMAAYGISVCNRKKIKYVNYYFIFIFLVAIAWNAFKLGGRGLL